MGEKSREQRAKRHVATLKRRLEHLVTVVDDPTRTDMSYLRAEISALNWAMPWLEQAVEEERIKEAVEAER